MKKLILLLSIILAPVASFAQLAPPTINLNPSQNGNRSTFITSVAFDFTFSEAVPEGEIVCYTINGVTPTATVAGTCDSGTTSYDPNSPSLSWGSISTTGSAVLAITTQAGQTNSSVATSGPLTIYAPPPVFSVGTGRYTSAQIIAIIAPPGARAPTVAYAICYTVDGTTPTAPTAGTCSGGTTQTYSGPITLTTGAHEVINAIITSSTLTNGPMVANVYTILASRAPQTWYVRSDGGTRYSNSTNTPTGQCNGMYDNSYASTGGTGVNQNCAFNDVRYLWQDSSYTYGYSNGTTTSVYPGWGWVSAGGDTVIIRGSIGTGVSYRVGCDPSNTNCTGFGVAGDSYNSGAPPPPSGTIAQPTQILGENYASCTTPAAKSQLHGGLGVGFILKLSGSSNVNLECIDFTDFSQCSQVGGSATPYPSSCGSTDDYSVAGLETDNTTANLLLQDVNIHGFTQTGLQGPIGGQITMTRVNVNFNASFGWDFDDGSDTPNNPSAAITANYVTMKGNGCNEEYPVVHSFPAISCYDILSGGFGDSWSGQDTTLASFICDHCQMYYNTKDGFIGPHVSITNLTITNSASYGNMGQQWKWGSTANSTQIFENNITGGNCNRMSAPLPGAPSTYNTYLSDFCRASDTVAPYIGANSSVLFANNTTYTNNPTVFDMTCNVYGTCGGSSIIFRNNVFLGYTNPNFPGSADQPPGLYYPEDSSVTYSADHNIEWGVRNGQCGTPPYGASSVGSTLCVSPQLVGQPTGTGTTYVESQMDNFNPNLASGSPAIGTGLAISGLTTDFNGTAYTSPPAMGAFSYGSVSPLNTITVTPVNTAATTMGGTVAMAASCLYSNGMTSPCVVTWTDTAIHSTVGSTTGIVTGLSVGTDTITATISAVSGNATVTISGVAIFYQFQGVTLLGRHN